MLTELDKLKDFLFNGEKKVRNFKIFVNSDNNPSIEDVARQINKAFMELGEMKAETDPGY